MNLYKEAFSVPGDVLVFTERGNAEDKSYRVLKLDLSYSIYSILLAFSSLKQFKY